METSRLPSIEEQRQLGFERARLLAELKESNQSFESVNESFEQALDTLDKEIQDRQHAVDAAYRLERSRKKPTEQQKQQSEVLKFLSARLESSLRSFHMLYQRRMGGLITVKNLVHEMEEIDEQLERFDHTKVEAERRRRAEAARNLGVFPATAKQDGQPVEGHEKDTSTSTPSTRGWCARLFGY